jgi:hypothetical protein
MMKTLRAEKAAETLSRRRETVGRIEALRNEQAATIPILQADRAEKEKMYLAAKAAMQSASDEFQAAHAALSIESNRATGEIGRQEQVLIESADPLLDEAITFFRDKSDDLRRPGRISIDRRGSENNIYTEKTTLYVESNRDAILAALQYCRDAIATLENWKLLPAVDAEKIAELKKGLPRIDIFTESTGTKPYGFTVANLNPLHLLPSDSQINWSIGKLNQKFKELMGR